MAKNKKNEALGDYCSSETVYTQNLTRNTGKLIIKYQLSANFEKPNPFWHTFGTSKPYPFWHTDLKTIPFLAKKLPKAHPIPNQWEHPPPPAPWGQRLSAIWLCLADVLFKGCRCATWPTHKVTLLWQSQHPLRMVLPWVGLGPHWPTNQPITPEVNQDRYSPVWVNTSAQVRSSVAAYRIIMKSEVRRLIRKVILLINTVTGLWNSLWTW